MQMHDPEPRERGEPGSCHGRDGGTGHVEGVRGCGRRARKEV
jgi:hypothetical protein